MASENQIKPQVDVLYLIRARIDTGRDKGAPQLRKDIRALKRAEEEIVRLRQEISLLRAANQIQDPTATIHNQSAVTTTGENR